MLVSCSNNTTTTNLQHLLGQQIVLPTDNGQWKILNRDTTIAVDNCRPKITVYYNAQGCTSCRLKELVSWNNLINDVQNMPKSDTSNVEFVFLFSVGENANSLALTLKQYQFSIPVLFDIQNSFEKVNIIPNDEKFHYFLLDKNNKIQLVGNPINNPAMWKLYKKRIAELNERS